MISGTRIYTVLGLGNRCRRKGAAVNECNATSSRTKMFTSKYICSNGTDSTKKANGLDIEKKETSKELIPLAFCVFKRELALPLNMLWKPSKRGMACHFMSRQAKV